MNRLFKKAMAVVLSLVVIFTALPNTAFAGANPGNSGDLLVKNYEILSGSSIITAHQKNISIKLLMKYTGDDTSINFRNITADRLVDSFSSGKCDVINIDESKKTFDILITGLTYKGFGNNLKTLVNLDEVPVQLTVPISECKEYQEPPSTPPTEPEKHPIPQPVLTINRNDIGALLKKNQEITVQLTIKNTGTVTAQSPIINYNVSDCLVLMGNSYSQQLPNIAPGKEEKVNVRIKATEKITSQNQYIAADIKFHYHNTISLTEGNSSGKVTIPSQLTKEKKNEENKEGVATATPNVIVKNYDFGGASVPAGSIFVLGVTLLNTSNKLSIENVVVTVQEADGFSISGSTNTFFFNKIKKRKSTEISIPIKINPTIESSVIPVSINVKYEYLDLKKRNQGSADLKVTVPVFQRDKFEISTPQIPAIGYVGEETSFTINYNNKGKGTIYNVEASISGDVTSVNPKQAIGNIEAGKSGIIAFAYSPNNEGSNDLKVKITYEDADGNAKKRIFTQTVNAEIMQIEDPMEGEENMPNEEEGKKFPWLPVIGVGIALLIAIIIIIKHNKKKALAKKEAMMWDNWDDENSSNDSNPVSDGGNK